MNVRWLVAPKRYLKAHLKAEVAGSVSLVSFLVTHDLISMSANRAAAVAAVCAWVLTHIVPNIPSDDPPKVRPLTS